MTKQLYKEEVMIKRILGLFLLVGLFLLAGCAQTVQPVNSPDMTLKYNQISQEKAQEMMQLDDGHVIVDVRRQDEYDVGHIPGAILIPNESIGDEMPAELPDFDQIILIYCRSGNRSKQAAEKLADIGYTQIYEFGGIQDWTGEIEVTVDEPEETVTEEKEAEEMITEEELQVVRMSAELVLEVNGKRFYPELAENSSAEAFFEKLKEGKLDLELHDYGSFEKVGPLPWELPRNDEQITTEPGDIILYQGDQLTIYYDENTWSFTRLGKITNVTKEELLEILGDGDVTASFWLEWSE